MLKLLATSLGILMTLTSFSAEQTKTATMVVVLQLWIQVQVSSLSLSQCGVMSFMPSLEHQAQKRKESVLPRKSLVR